MTLATRPPEAVIRQFARAVCADRLIGDELMRLTMADFPRPVLDRGSALSWLKSFVSNWQRYAGEPHDTQAPFSEEALKAALPPPPNRDRLILLLADVLGLTPSEAVEVVGPPNPSTDRLAAARVALTIPAETDVLVVEDDPLTAADIGATVARLGAESVRIAKSANEAIEAARAHRPDIILTDYDLDGDQTGVDAVRAIRQTYDCPVIFVSAYPDDILIGQEGEPDFVITKPYSVLALRAAIAHALDARHRQINHQA